MNIVLWVLQVLLAVAFFAHGLMALMPPPEIAVLMNAALPRAFWVFLGVAEIAAAIGITLPGVTRILPGLVPAAAAGIMFVMVSATVWHIVRAEYSSAAITVGTTRDGDAHCLRTLARPADPPAPGGVTRPRQSSNVPLATTIARAETLTTSPTTLTSIKLVRPSAVPCSMVTRPDGTTPRDTS